MVDEISELLLQLEKFDRNKPPDLQLQACIKLAELGKTTSIQNKQRIINALKEAINCNNCAATRAQAVEALGDLRAKDGIERLKSSLQDPYRLVRSYSIKALRQLNDESAIYALINSLKDEFFGVRCEAAKALKGICDKKSSDECQAAYRSLDKTVRECEEALKNPDLDEEKRSWYERLKKEAQRERPDFRPY